MIRVDICIKMIISNCKIPLIETSSIYFLRKKCCPISEIFPFHNIYDPFWVIDYLSSILIVLIHCKTYHKKQENEQRNSDSFPIGIILWISKPESVLNFSKWWTYIRYQMIQMYLQLTEIDIFSVCFLLYPLFYRYL